MSRGVLAEKEMPRAYRFQRFAQGGYVHAYADLIFDTIETYAARIAGTTLLLLWLYRHIVREFNRRD